MNLSGIDQPATWIALLSLTAMEIVLGIDNIVFISILTGKLPPEKRQSVARLGLGLAMISRIGLLFALSWVMGLTKTIVTLFGNDLSGRDLILLGGGILLVGKATNEIHSKVEGADEAEAGSGGTASVATIIAQILVLDIVFSLDSVITAVGMVPPDQIWVMVAAVVVSVLVMLAFAQPIGEFVMRHPSVKILALSFLILIGVLLIADGFGQKISKGYVYFAMAFSLAVEMVNMRFRRNKAAAGSTPSP